MKALRGLTEIVELEFLLNESPQPAMHCHVDKIRQLSIEILQASKCHKDCPCNHRCGCNETGNCEDCNPPKRILRLMTSCWPYWEVPNRTEEIRVLPERVLSTIVIS